MARVEVAQFIERLGKGKMLPGILLLGADAYLRDSCREKIIETFLTPEMRDWGARRYSLRETSLDEIFRQAQTLPMLSRRQVLTVSDVESLEWLGDKSRDAAVEQFDDYFKDPAPFTVLVLEATELDARMKVFKTLAAHTLVVSAELSEDPQTRVATAVAITLQMARDAGVEIELAAAEELAEMLNGELALIRTEIAKLATYLGERKCITEADVDALVVSERSYTIWELTDLLATRQRDRALVFLDSLVRAGEKPPMIVGALAWMFRALIHAQERPPLHELMKQSRVHPRKAEWVMKLAPRIPRQMLLEGLRALCEADNQLKSGTKNERAVLEYVVARLTAPVGN